MFVTALLAATLAAPVPKAKAAELYYPTVEGTKRVMQTKSEDGTSLEATLTLADRAFKILRLLYSGNCTSLLNLTVKTAQEVF